MSEFSGAPARGPGAAVVLAAAGAPLRGRTVERSPRITPPAGAGEEAA